MIFVTGLNVTFDESPVGSMNGALFSSMPKDDYNYTIGTSFGLFDKKGMPVLINNVTALHMESEINDWNTMGVFFMVSMVDILDNNQNHEATWNVTALTMYDEHHFAVVMTENPLQTMMGSNDTYYYYDDDSSSSYNNDTYNFSSVNSIRIAEELTGTKHSLLVHNDFKTKLSKSSSKFALSNTTDDSNDDYSGDDDNYYYVEGNAMPEGDQFMVGLFGMFSGPSTDW